MSLDLANLRVKVDCVILNFSHSAQLSKFTFIFSRFDNLWRYKSENLNSEIDCSRNIKIFQFKYGQFI